MVKLKFPRQSRLLTSRNFDFVFQKPKRASGSGVTIFGRSNYLAYARLGLIVPKKNIRRSHERNQFKRLVRENFRMHQHKFPAMDFVVLAKKRVKEVDNQTFLKELKRLWLHNYP